MRLEEKSSLALVDFLCQNRSDKKEFVSHLPEQGLSAPDQPQSSACFVLTSQQLFGEENSGGKHGSSLQRPAPQARVSQVTAQSKSSATHGYPFRFFFFFLLCTSDFTCAMTTSSLALPTVNSAGETALDAAKRLQYTQCIELVSSASAPSSSLPIYRGSDCKNSSISSRKCRT